ncbi:hypothetical protein NKH18_34755 [Streptomyces sp. M10(2022)]
MTDKDVEQPAEQPAQQQEGTGPWWAWLGPLGAVGLIVFGVLLGAWVFLRPTGTSDTQAIGYYQAAKAIAVGLVIAGSALLSRIRSQGAAAEENQDQKEAVR